MLSKGFRDESKEQLNQIFNSGLQLEYQPDMWEQEQRASVDEILQKAIGFSLSEIEKIPTDVLHERLRERNFQLDTYEKLGDLLQKVLPLEPKELQPNLAKRVVSIYETAQNESKTFSFGLIQKINSAKEKL